jgi:hypothetical protein
LTRVTKKFISNYIAENEIGYDCTHTRLCVPIIDRIYRKMLVGIKFSEIKIDDTLICDGHHRYLASLLANYALSSVPSTRTSASKQTDWKSVYFDDEDWDTAAKIKFLNEQDADYNDISIEELVEILK